MSLGSVPTRLPLLGQLALLGLLLVSAGLLLPLHGGDWWPAAPAPGRLGLAIAIAAAWLLATAACLRPARALPAAAAARDRPGDPVLVAWASQTGFAASLAERSAAMLRAGGREVVVLPLEQVDAARLARTRQALFVASTTGEGDPPDHAVEFLRQMGDEDGSTGLAGLEYALLALGDRSYEAFCGFGRQLDGWLRAQGARPLFDRVEVDNADQSALRHWQYEVARFGGDPAGADWSTPAYLPWQLVERRHLNPGSPGGPVHALSLVPSVGALPAWQPGDIAEIGPRHAPAVVAAWLRDARMDPQALVDTGDGPEPLASVLARSRLPVAEEVAGTGPHALAAALQRLPHREYSIASIPAEGRLQLLVREMYAADGNPGLGSGWLCRHAPPGGVIDLRIRGNPGFHPPDTGRPLVLVGNGTGMAGLRAHLAARVAAGARRNWLLFGERGGRDLHFAQDLRRWQDDGWLERLDLAYSREGDRAYVQDRLEAAAVELAAWVEQGAVILVCGSAGTMAPAVDAVLGSILGAGRRDQLRAQGRYRRDVY